MTEQNTNIQPTSVAEDEIDLIQLAKTLWEGRKRVIKTTIIFMAIGLFIALFSPKEYTATTTMVPQSGEGGSKIGGLGGLAAMAGINLGSMGAGEELSPTLYPQIVNSIPFQKELMQTQLVIEGGEQSVTFIRYYEEIYNPGLLGILKKYTIGLPGVILKALRSEDTTHLDFANKNLLSISGDEKELIEKLTEQLSLEVNDKDGYVTLSANMPEAFAAAQLTKKAQELLQQYITAFKVQKAEEQLKFVEERFAEKKKEFEAVQDKLAAFLDRNRNVTTAMAQTEQKRLESEYDLAYSVYSELAKQLETARIQVKEDTPVFTIIEPVSVPTEKSKPKRPLILVIWTFLGAIVGVGLVFGKEYLKGVKEKWREE